MIDDFADCISFFPCNRNDSKERELHLNKLDYLCQNGLEQPNLIIVITDASVKPNRFRLFQLLMGDAKVFKSSHPKLHSGISQPQMLN